MALNVSQPGRFKDPRSGDYFSVDAEGKIEFYEMSKVKMVDIKLPCEEHYGEALLSMVESVTVSCGLGWCCCRNHRRRQPRLDRCGHQCRRSF